MRHLFLNVRNPSLSSLVSSWFVKTGQSYICVECLTWLGGSTMLSNTLCLLMSLLSLGQSSVVKRLYVWSVGRQTQKPIVHSYDWDQFISSQWRRMKQISSDWWLPFFLFNIIYSINLILRETQLNINHTKKLTQRLIHAKAAKLNLYLIFESTLPASDKRRVFLSLSILNFSLCALSSYHSVSEGDFGSFGYLSITGKPLILAQLTTSLTLLRPLIWYMTRVLLAVTEKWCH